MNLLAHRFGLMISRNLQSAPHNDNKSNMTIAICDRKGSFSDRWIASCREYSIPFVTVDLFDDSLFKVLSEKEVHLLLLHPPMGDRTTALAAGAVINSVSSSGRLGVFPTPTDYWHFDNKIAQKYLFDAAGIDTPETHVFLTRDEALEWAKSAYFPWVFKLKAGAGSINVSLVRNQKEAIARIDRMFGSGYPPHDGAIKDIANKIRRHERNRDWLATAKRAPMTFKTWRAQRKQLNWERGYAYFQEFVDGNSYDTRVTVIGNRAFAFRRMVRPGDFRASGSGDIDHEPNHVDTKCVELAFEAAKRLGTTCMAFDFVKVRDRLKPLIVEMSFAFNPHAVFACPGHWRSDLSWSEGRMWPQDAILEDLMRKQHEQKLGL